MISPILESSVVLCRFGLPHVILRATKIIIRETVRTQLQPWIQLISVLTLDHIDISPVCTYVAIIPVRWPTVEDY